MNAARDGHDPPGELAGQPVDLIGERNGSGTGGRKDGVGRASVGQDVIPRFGFFHGCFHGDLRRPVVGRLSSSVAGHARDCNRPMMGDSSKRLDALAGDLTLASCET